MLDLRMLCDGTLSKTVLMAYYYDAMFRAQLVFGDAQSISRRSRQSCLVIVVRSRQRIRLIGQRHVGYRPIVRLTPSSDLV